MSNNMLKKSVLRLSVAVALLAATGSVFSASTSANLGVSASVSQNCTISTTGLAFAAYDPVLTNAATALNANGTVTVACTRGSTGLTIGMGDGSNFSATRRMVGPAAGDYLAYNLYQPSTSVPNAACTFPGTTAWTNVAPLALSAAGNKGERTYNVCGTIPGGQDVTAGSYNDTVVATITY